MRGFRSDSLYFDGTSSYADFGNQTQYRMDEIVEQVKAVLKEDRSLMNNLMRALLPLAGFGAGAAAVYLMMVKPKDKEIAKLRAELEELRESNSSYRNKLRGLEGSALRKEQEQPRLARTPIAYLD